MKTIQNIFRELLLGMTLVLIMTFVLPEFVAIASASTLYLPADPFGEGFAKPEGTGVQLAKTLIGSIVDNVRFIIGAIAILTIIIASIRLIMAEGNEEVFNKQRTTILLAIVGLIVVGLAGELSKILTVEQGGFLRDPSKTLQQVRIFDRSVRIVLTIIKYLIGSIAVLFIVRSGLRMVTMGGNEEELGKDKKSLAWGIVGLLFILLANPLVNKVFYKVDVTRYPGVEPVRPALDVGRGVAEIIGFTNLVVKFVGPVAMLAFLAGGIMYMAAGGEDEKVGKAKKIMLWALIGIIVIYGAFGVVSTFVAGRF